MAEVAVEERQLLKSMRWYDGFVVALTMPAALIASLGFSVGALGAWGAIALWGVSMVMATLMNWIYSEMASMFPEKAGGIALYAHEAWRRYLSFVGPLATFGYWFAWTSVLAIFGQIIGALVQAQWFPGQDWVVDAGFVDVTFVRVVAAVTIVLIWAANMVGLRSALRVAYVTGGLLMIPLFVFIVLPYFTGDWKSSNLTWGIDGGWTGIQLALVWLYIMGWTSFGVETCAAFTPEYKEGTRDTSRALRTSAVFSLAVFTLLPLGVIGAVGEGPAIADPVGFYAPAFAEIVGGAADIMVVLIIGSLVLVMNTSMADGSRALYGIAEDRMTIKQLAQLNRFHVPGRALTVGLIVNLVLTFFVGSILAILAAANLGYILAHFFAVTGFLLLRKDRPAWTRPIRLPAVFVPVAALLAVVLAVIIVVGATSFSITGYGGTKELLIALGLLASSVLLFAYRRRVQDRGRLTLREPEREESRPRVAAP